MAILVESKRVDGKPKQRHIAYLGSFKEHWRDVVQYRVQWWQDMSERLDRLGNLITPDDRRRIEAALAKRMPPVTAEDLAAPQDEK